MKQPIMLTMIAASLMFLGVTAASLIGLFWGFANLFDLPHVMVMAAEVIGLAISIALTIMFGRMVMRAELSLKPSEKPTESAVQAG